MKRFSVFLFILLFVLVMPAHVFSETNTLTLEDEQYLNGKIIKFYQDQDNEPFTFAIDVPFEYQKKVEHADDKVLEAKKQLTTIYLNLGLKDRQKELDNVSLFGFEHYNLTIDFDYKMTFKHHQRKAYEYAKRQHESFKQLSPKEQEHLYDTSRFIYMDYKEVIEMSSNEEIMPTKVVKSDSLNESVDNQDNFKLSINHILISFLIIFLFVIVIFILRKR